MDKLKQNLSIYENLLENESDKINNNQEGDKLKVEVVNKIRDYINKII